MREEGEVEYGGVRVKDFKVVQRFDKVTYWNHDTSPSSTDWLPKTLQWQSDAPVLHGQVTDVEFAAAEAAMEQRRMSSGATTS